ncbi:MAG: hypothetical protein H7246_16440 [Phycisphaerae bacterium]|nr:hypothetical protein [Saprospiraceae bacterium]
MTKLLAIPALISLMFLFSSCCEDALTHIILDDDTVCGEDVNTGYQPVSENAKRVLFPIATDTRLIFVNQAGEEMTLSVKKATDQKSTLNYKVLCSNYDWNTCQYEFCNGQMLDYTFESDPAHGIKIYYSMWVDFVKDDSGTLFDQFSARLWTDELGLSGGNLRLVADNRGQQLPAELTKPGDWERVVGDTTMLGHPFHDVTYTNWGMNQGRGIFFQKGLGIIGIYAGNEVIWVLDRVE